MDNLGRKQAAQTSLPPANLRDGKCGIGKHLVGPSSSCQLAQEFPFDPSKVGDIVKKKRKKRLTAAKKIQFEDRKLFQVQSPSEKSQTKQGASTDDREKKRRLRGPGSPLNLNAEVC